jgi:hypothetical protein
MFQVSLCPSSGDQTACHCSRFPVLAMVVVVPESRVARCVHCAEDVASKILCTVHTSHIGTQSALLMMGIKTPETMLRNNRLPINHHMLHLVGLAFIYLHYEMYNSRIYMMYCRPRPTKNTIVDPM